MGERRAGARREDCEWYHTFELTDGSVIRGAWDLRGGETAYLGGVDLAGKRVFEPGPASGYLSFWMERQGAEVVSFETGWDVAVHLLPVDGMDMHREQLNIMETVDRVHNSWWYMHRHYGSAAKLVHGDLYALPGDLGSFDVSVFGALLLHLREPWGALQEAARRTTGTMVVTDVRHDPTVPLEANVLEFSPLATHEISNWWSINPGAVVRMLERLGFPRTRITEHTQSHHLGHVMDEDLRPMAMWTVVGERA
jgi:O-methyltransferase